MSEPKAGQMNGNHNVSKKKSRMLWLVLACLLTLYKYVHATYTPLDSFHGLPMGGALLHSWGLLSDIRGAAAVHG